MKKILIALPALDEEASIRDVLRRLPRALDGAGPVSWLVVDDGSADRTAAIAAEEGARVVRHARTLGVGQAFHTALEEALRRGADILVTVDADGQFDPDQIVDLIDPILTGRADFVTGTRFSTGARPEGMPIFKYWGNRLVTAFLRYVTGQDLTDVSCGFRAYSRDALFHLNLFGKFTYTQETILDLSFKGLRLTEVPASVRYFPGRESRVASSVLRYGFNALAIITRTARDFKPMRFFGWLGVAAILLGLGLDGWLFAHFLRTSSFSPYKFVGFVGVTFNVAGIVIFALALFADMLDRMRINQERLLYYQRRAFYDPSSTRDEPR